MTFTSLHFLIFFCVFLCAYWQTQGIVRLWICLAGSYLFYGWWNWYLLSLILFSTVVDYFVALAIERTDSPRRQKWLLIASVATNLGLLGFFKYFNFFADSLQVAASQIGWQLDWVSLNIILPVGISFYTFQSLSYTIDVYRKRIKPEPGFVRFATFVAFFPQLVAGPIVRASELLPQLQSDREYKWEDTVKGFGQMLLGFFKKLVVADSLAVVVDQMFDSPESYSSLNLILVSILFAFQIYGDFSGYSDIAIGSARMLGLRFPRNFLFPFFATSISDFWQRWHISLSTWLKDYLYIPLGGNRNGRWVTYRNLLITMTLGGLWHGAMWTFVVWGLLYGILLVVEKEFRRIFSIEPSSKGARIMKGAGTMRGVAARSLLPIAISTIFVMTMIIFRSASMSDAILIYGRILSLDDFSPNSLHNRILLLKGIGVVVLFFMGELVWQLIPFEKIFKAVPPLRAFAYAGLVWCIALLGSFDGQAFVYFQF